MIWDKLQFAGVEIALCKDNFEIYQHNVVPKLVKMNKTSTLADFRSRRAKLLWITNSRTGVSCTSTILRQTTEDRFKEWMEGDPKETNDVVSHHVRTLDFTLKFPKLDKESLMIHVYSGASYASNMDRSLQPGQIIFLTNRSKSCSPIHCISYNPKRVTRLVLGSELMAFADTFDIVLTIK